MKDGTLIVFTGDKGGVGKSTLAVLMTEWFLSQGKQVRLVDADPNQTLLLRDDLRLPLNHNRRRVSRARSRLVRIIALLQTVSAVEHRDFGMAACQSGLLRAGRPGGPPHSKEI